MKDVLKTDSYSNLSEFIVNVETRNSNKVSDMVENTINICFDVDSTLRELKSVTECPDVIHDEILEVRSVLVELQRKLLNLKENSTYNLYLVEDLFNDSVLLYAIGESNRKLIINEEDC